MNFKKKRLTATLGIRIESVKRQKRVLAVVANFNAFADSCQVIKKVLLNINKQTATIVSRESYSPDKSDQKMGDFIHVNVTNSQNDVVSFEKKFPKDIKIIELKVNLEKAWTFVLNTKFHFFFLQKLRDSSRCLLMDLTELNWHEITLIELGIKKIDLFVCYLFRANWK